MKSKLRAIVRIVLRRMGIWKIWHKMEHYADYLLAASEFASIVGSNRLVFAYTYKGQHKDISHSQYGQELYIEQLFGGGGQKVFIEVGGNDPVTLSNSYALEKLGWTGMSFEPITFLCNKWKGVRTTPCYPYLIGDEEAEVDFWEIEGEKHVFSRVAVDGEEYPKTPYSTKKKKVRRLENILRENNIERVDVLFVDVEGYELDVLKGIDFDKVRITCICTEAHPFTKKNRATRRYLCDKGYDFMAKIGGDDIFIISGWSVKH